MRRIVKIGLFALIPLLLLGHVLYWYWPRERAAAPDPGGLPARLLASGAYDACLWAPYPHQNLGVLSGEVADGSAYLAAVARVAEVPPPVLPSFGPFAVPPAIPGSKGGRSGIRKGGRTRSWSGSSGWTGGTGSGW
jgi:hypothetical protein